MSPRLQFALELAHDAGRSTLALFDTGHAVDFKEDRSPVTAADREAERIIRKALRESYPADGILGEEEGEAGPIDNRWVVDPIDGTKSFICGVPLYATLLSYEEDGHPVVGVAYFPALEQMLYAERGKGAFLNGRHCSVSKKDQIGQAVICCGSHFSMEAHGKTRGLLDLAQKCLATRTWGDAYGHALVATGRIEAMIDPVVKRYDISAMQLIVEEAGGRCTTFANGSNPQTEAVSSNGVLHDLILGQFKA